MVEASEPWPHRAQCVPRRGSTDVWVIERACALATDLLIDVDDLPNALRTCPSVVAASPGVRPLHDVERDYILAVLQRNGGDRNKAQTAEQLRIDATTLFRKLKRYAKAS